MNYKVIAKAKIDIENAKNQSVITIIVPVFEYTEDESFIFDISGLTTEELNILKDAIDINISYTDIELFYISTENGLLNYGDDYEYTIENKLLKGKYVRNQYLKGGK